MSTSTSGSNGTAIVSGPDVIQKSDFYVHAGILHPLIVGSIAVIVLFFYLRLGSNRTVAPITVFDWVINVALGSTLAGIVNGNSLVRGLLALATMLAFQYFTSFLSTRYRQRFQWIFCAPPLVLVFRGELLYKVMAKHRISESDIFSALRQAGHLDICLIEAVIIEANGTFSIITMEGLKDIKGEPKALMNVPAYKALYEAFEKKEAEEEQKRRTGENKDCQNGSDAMPTLWKSEIALDNARPEGTGWNVQSVIPV